MANYKELVPFILRWEGGFTNNKNDRGGWTCKGVTLATFRSVYGANKTPNDLKYITTEQWMHIFKKLFWDKCKADQIEDQSVANMLVDWAWNAGAINPIKALQRCVGVTADGIVGSRTLAAVNSRSPLALFGQLREKRIAYYKSIAEGDPRQKVNLKGWLNRVNHIQYGKLY